jgi:hypothetical protein
MGFRVSTVRWAATTRREVVSRFPVRPSLGGALRRLRIARHRALRWFGVPIAVTERERRDRDLAPSVWQYEFPPATLH